MASKRVFSELNALLDKQVTIKLKDGRTIKGTLYGFDDKLNILLKNATENEGNSSVPTMLIYSDYIAYLSAIEAPIFNPDEFARLIVSKLNIREADIKTYPEAGVLVILNNIRVSDKGVEGSGPLAHKIYGLYTEYIENKKKEIEKR
ncbi:Like-Sm ribonucleoprotein, core [Fervidicoccus fontis Kam940]|uniref:Like-Sm ribonucleoprotein, core n=2 Tax=Fervidicoccus fontis TaxID=683846 RepID=I0A234_FERFK|nr:Like-Sm ribonucleoprotein, core [Fervidicoccus fontis Kam940]